MILLALLGVLLLAAAAFRHARKPPVRIVFVPGHDRVAVSIKKRAFHSWPQQLRMTSGYEQTPSLLVGYAEIGDDDKLAALIVKAHSLIDAATGKNAQAAEMARLAKVLAGKRS